MNPVRRIAISPSISLPSDAVTQTLACIGRKGAGKTYLATKLAEEMIDISAQVVVIDPVGNWWGLRVAEDGKGKGKDIFIAGGEHGDVPLAPEVGAVMARIIVNKGISIVLDVSSFRQGERKRFAADFAEEFFHLKKKQRSAVHLFVEEAQLFAPQRTGPEEARMLGAFENIVRLGRNYGIGATLITQRPQSVNKEVLSQVECLCVLQVNGSHERKALEEWVQEAGADRKLVGQLPGLGRGEGFVWSPSWLRVFQRVFFAKKSTFDASATPEVGRKTAAALLSKVDIETLKSDLNDVIAKAEADDPKVLHRKISQLEAELKKVTASVAPSVPSPEEIEAIVYRQMETFYERAHRDIGERTAEKLFDAAGKLRSTADFLDETGCALSKKSNWQLPEGTRPEPKTPSTKTAIIERRQSTPSRTLSHAPVNLRSGARRMLATLCQWSPSGRTEAQLAAQVQMKRTGGTWSTYKSDLRGSGFIEIRDGLWFATQAGMDAMGSSIPPSPSTTAEVVALWGEKLRKGAREMLDVLVSRHGREMARDDLGAAVGLESSGGTFSTYISDLKQAGLIVVERGFIRANAETLMIQRK